MSYIVLDIECSMKPKHKPWIEGAYLSSIGIEKQDGTYNAWFFNPLVGDDSAHIAEISKIISETDVIVGHNIKFDATWLVHFGIDLRNKSLFCTQVAEYLILGQACAREDDLGLSLNAVAARYKLGSKVDAMAEFWDSGVDTDQIPLHIHEEYLKQDVQLTHEIFRKQRDILLKANLSTVAQISFDVSKVIAYMEYNGVKFDKDFALSLRDELDSKLQIIDTELKSVAGIDFSPDSNQQLAAVLYGGTLKHDGVETYTRQLKDRVKECTRKCKILTEYPGMGFDIPENAVSEKTGIGKTDKETVKLLKATTPEQKKFVELLQSRGGTAKASSTLFGKGKDAGYMSKLDSSCKLHPQFNQTVTRTGRLSSSEPNGQNLPRKGTSPIKKCIIPVHDYIVNVDFGQIEWRMAACLSEDPVMIEETCADIDVHSLNARTMFGADKYEPTSPEFKALRQAAKTVTFRLLYGGSGYAFFMDNNMPKYTLPKWESIVDDFYNKYRGLKTWQNRNYSEVTRNGYLRTPSGRVLTYDKTIDKNGGLAYNRKQICNYSVQSISADIMFLTMQKAFSFLVDNNCESRILLAVHDSLVLDVPEKELDFICKNMLTIFGNVPIYCKQHFDWSLPVPIVGDCEYGKNYAELSPYEIEQ